MKQRAAFLMGEGNAWWRRNKDKDQPDPVLEFLRNIKTRSVLEIGCGGGKRLDALRQRYFADDCLGIDPSAEAIAHANKTYPACAFRRGTADDLGVINSLDGRPPFEMVIFGFCLYLCDPEDLFSIAAEADRAVAAGGWLVIHDFYSDKPYRNAYEHREGLWSHKMAFERMFLWHPAYQFVRRQSHSASGKGPPKDPDDRVDVVLIRKEPHRAYLRGERP